MKHNCLLTILACLVYLWSAQQQTGVPLIEYFVLIVILLEIFSRRRLSKFLYSSEQN